MHSARDAAVSPESVSQAGAGGLLFSVGVAELALEVGAAGWLHLTGTVVLAFLGAAVLARGIRAIVAVRRRRRPVAPRATALPATAEPLPLAAGLHLRRVGREVGCSS